MAIQFGMARIIMRDASETPNMVELGHVQSGSVDFSFDKAVLFSGATLFPVDIRYHSGQVTGRLQYAALTAAGFQYLLGGSRSGSEVTIDENSEPPFWMLEFRLITSGTTFKVTLVQCTSGRLSWDFAREGHVIPEAEFSAFADSSGNVAILEVGDVS